MAGRSLSDHGEYRQFGDGAVLVNNPEVLTKLRRLAKEATERKTEAGGLLYGRVLDGRDGSCVVVDHFVEGKDGGGTRWAFDLSAQDTQRLRDEAARRFPGDEEVGWWHTHEEESPYSQTDRDTQRQFQLARCVGLLVFGVGPVEANAYLGPASKPLGAPQPQGAPASLKAAYAVPRARAVRTTRRRPAGLGVRGLIVIASIIVGLVFASGLVCLGMYLVMHLSTRLSVTVSCNSDGPWTGKETCWADGVWPSADIVEWYLGDKLYAKNIDYITVPVANDGVKVVLVPPSVTSLTVPHQQSPSGSQR